MISDSKYILYYPSIEFHSDNWVKSSLLVWDRVYRIVPTNYIPNDSETIKELFDNGLVRNVTLSESDVKKASNGYIKLCNNLPFIPAGLEVGDEARLHPEKIDSRLYPALDNIAHYINSQGFLTLPKELARGYMYYLAKVVAERRNFVRGTNSLDNWSIAPFFTENANFDEFAYSDDAEGYYCSLFLEDLIPKSIELANTKDLIKFVKKRRNEKALLRMKLNELCNSISQVSDREQVFTEVRDFLNEVKKAKEEVRKSMDILNLANSSSSLFSVGLPVGMTALGALGLFTDPFSLTSIFSSTAMSALAAFSNFKLVKTTNRNTSYASYLIDIDKMPSPSVSNKMARSFEEFLND